MTVKDEKLDRVAVDITGIGYTFRQKNESEESAKNRIAGHLLQGEIRANEGEVRIHLHIKIE